MNSELSLFTEEQLSIRDAAAAFAEQHLKPNSAQWESDGMIPAETIRAMGELGLLGMLVPEAWGGAGTDYVSYVLAIEEIAAGDGSCSTLMSVNNSVVCLPILDFGSQAQKSVWLTKLATGQCIGAFCLTEPDAGSDASQIKTQAQKNAQGYLLNGVKQFITSGREAAVAIVIAVTDATLGKKGLSAFLVPTNLPGFKVACLEEKMGQKASSTAQLVFDNLQLPADALLGKEGEGYKIALANLEGGRLGIAAQCLGMAKAAFEIARRYAGERKAFGVAIKDHQAIGFRLADMATQLTAARELLLMAAKRRTMGLSCRQEAAMAKVFASEMAERVVSNAIQVLGGYGYLRDYQVERIYRDVRVAQIYEGTNDILRLVIAKTLDEI